MNGIARATAANVKRETVFIDDFVGKVYFPFN